MNGLLRTIRTSSSRTAAGAAAALTGFVIAALVGVALARTFTLKVAKNARVTNQAGTIQTENIVVTSRGRAVYLLTGDSARHPKCTKANSCFSFWPPVTVASRKQLSKATGIRGKLGVWHRNGFFQVTLAGHPLYRYAGDSHKDRATGEGIKTFGGTWHVIKGAAAARATSPASGNTGTVTTSTTSTMMTGNSTTCAYPPYC